MAHDKELHNKRHNGAKATALRVLRRNHPIQWRAALRDAEVAFIRANFVEYDEIRRMALADLKIDEGWKDARIGRIVTRDEHERRHACPFCGARKGEPCRQQPSGEWCKPHRARKDRDVIGSLEPRQFVCPQCKEDVGNCCRTASGKPCAPHTARIDVAKVRSDG